MALRKHGVGEVLPDDDSQQHTASQGQWNEEDEQALVEEDQD